MVDGRHDRLLNLLVKVLDPLLNQLLIRCEAEYDHEAVEVLDSQELARLLFAPIFEQILEHVHVLFVHLRLRHRLDIYGVVHLEVVLFRWAFILVFVVKFTDVLKI